MSENSIRKQMDAINKGKRDLSKTEEETISRCTHTINGEPSFVLSNEPMTEGQRKYICKQCHKVIVVTRIEEDELQNACNTIDRAIDIIKMTTGGNTEDDDLLHRLAKLQYRIRNELVPAYKAALKKENGRSNKRSNNNSGDATWARPVTSRNRQY